MVYYDGIRGTFRRVKTANEQARRLRASVHNHAVEVEYQGGPIDVHCLDAQELGILDRHQRRCRRSMFGEIKRNDVLKRNRRELREYLGRKSFI
jgi:hypothetical protein